MENYLKNALFWPTTDRERDQLITLEEQFLIACPKKNFTPNDKLFELWLEIQEMQNRTNGTRKEG